MKNVYIVKLENIVNKYNNTYNRTIKMKPIKVNILRYFNQDVECNDKDPKFKVGDHVRTSKYKKMFSRELARRTLF